MVRHDIIAIGASAGGVQLVLDLAPELPPDLPASVFVVLHTAPGYLSPLPELLSERGPLPAVHPLHGDPIEPGRIYVAPPDNHLQVGAGFVEVVHGARENGHRPSVDALFRTAARAYGPRVIGVVLSGFQDCGTAGMLSVAARGGITVVQDPNTAAAREMPASVLRHMRVDHVVRPAELPGLLARLVEQPAADERHVPSPQLEVLEGERGGRPVQTVCPLCNGSLTEAEVAGFERYRCHEGHAFSLQSLADHQAEETERALWAAARALDESAALSARLSRTGMPELRERFADHELTQRRQAEIIRRVLLAANGTASPRDHADERQAAGDDR